MAYYINDNTRRELTEEISRIIQGSQKYIKTGNFLFQDNSITGQLISAMERGVVVFILSNIRSEDDFEYSDEDDSNLHGNRQSIQSLHIKELQDHGAHCHFLDALHAKFIIADGTQGMVMSANYLHTSLDRNIETGISVNGNELKELEQVFEILFLNSDITKMESKNKTSFHRKLSAVPDNTFSFIKSNLKVTIDGSSSLKGEDAPQKKNNLYRCREHTIYKSILNVIEGAKKYLILVTWKFKQVDENNLPGFLSALNKAKNRGVEIFCYSHKYKTSDEDKKVLINVVGKSHYFTDECNHSKCVVSENDGLVFTANIDGERGMTHGFELGCKLNPNDLFEVQEHSKKLVNYGR